MRNVTHERQHGREEGLQRADAVRVLASLGMLGSPYKGPSVVSSATQ